MISYAQNGEDVILNRLFPSEYQGFYVDAGAAHPDVHSVTRHFYERGWRGINIEPLRGFFDLLCQTRPEDVNINAALSDVTGSATLLTNPDSLGMSTLSASWAAGAGAPKGHVPINVPVTTLSEVFTKHALKSIDFLKIDVEGWERQVVAGVDWERWRPRVVLLEAHTDADHDSWRELLESARYSYGHFDGINRYYVRAEDVSLLDRLRPPLSVLDDFVPHGFVEPLVVAHGQLSGLRPDCQGARATLESTMRAVGVAVPAGTEHPELVLTGWAPQLRAQLQRATRGRRSRR
ncbi:MAG: FkbM family methyltransferase [Actinomycetota bacterium]|nr:FkbM family methyltransferase [Actinomycetota bacterium]